MNKPKESRRKQIIKIKAEINKYKTDSLLYRYKTQGQLSQSFVQRLIKLMNLWQENQEGKGRIEGKGKK